MENRDVTPHYSLLEQIFTTEQPKAISIILQNWYKCILKAEWHNDLKDEHSACVVRLEAESECTKTFTTIASLQKIAATILPDLVPQTFHVGKAQNVNGRQFTSQWSSSFREKCADQCDRSFAMRKSAS